MKNYAYMQKARLQVSSTLILKRRIKLVHKMTLVELLVKEEGAARQAGSQFRSRGHRVSGV